MATYRLTTFAGVTLPIYNVQLDTPVEAASTLLQTVNGYHDLRGSKRQFALPAMVRMRAVVAQYDAAVARAHLLVNGGNRLVVNGGNPLLIVTQSPGQVREQMDVLRGLVGVRGLLGRVALYGEPSATQTLLARLLAVRPTNRRLPPGVEEVELQFEALAPTWTGAVGNASGLTLICTVGGNAPVRDATLTITGTTAATRVVGPGIDISWSGSGQTLVLSEWAATANGSATSVTYNAGHTVDTLIELSPGRSTLTVSGAGSASLAWTESWL